MSFPLDEFCLKTYAENVVVIPTNADQVKEYKKEMVKEKQMILDGVRDHIVSHISSKNIAKEIWHALAGLFQNPFEQWKMSLKEKLRYIRMQKGEGIDLFLTKI